MTDPDDIWDRIARPATGNLNARRHPDSTQVWCALDDSGRRHLLVESDDDTSGPGHLLSVRGLSATIDRLALDDQVDRAWIDIACLDPAMHDMFGTVASDLVHRVDRHPGEPARAVIDTLEAWQWFWGNRRGPLSDDEALGLFAELWFLDRWAPMPGALNHWTGPDRDRHDFVTGEVSVEIKATRVRTDGPARHRITHLDQLADPETGHLLLFSLQATPDQLASNSLTGLIERLQDRYRNDPTTSARLTDMLDRAGWDPRHSERHRQGLRVVAEELYAVEGDFPRLTRSTLTGGVPTGVDDITYSIDLAACASHRVATGPDNATDRLIPLGT